MPKSNIIFGVILTLFVFLLISNPVLAQSDKVDAVYLKNGSIIKGEIVEFYPDSLVKIETYDGSLFVFRMEEVIKILKDVKNESRIIDSQVSDEVTKKHRTKFGIKGGVNISTWYENKIIGTDYENKIDIAIGLFIIRQLPIPIRFEVLYNRKGAIEKWNSSNSQYNYTEAKTDYKIDCISLIPLVVLGTKNIKNKLILEFGPEISFMTSKKRKHEISGEKNSSYIDNMVLIDCCLIAGIGAFIDNTLIFDIRYSYGLNDLMENDYTNGSKTFSRNIQLMFGYVF